MSVVAVCTVSRPSIFQYRRNSSENAGGINQYFPFCVINAWIYSYQSSSRGGIKRPIWEMSRTKVRRQQFPIGGDQGMPGMSAGYRAKNSISDWHSVLVNRWHCAGRLISRTFLPGAASQTTCKTVPSTAVNYGRLMSAIRLMPDMPSFEYDAKFEILLSASSVGRGGVYYTFPAGSRERGVFPFTAGGLIENHFPRLNTALIGCWSTAGVTIASILVVTEIWLQRHKLLSTTLECDIDQTANKLWRSPFQEVFMKLQVQLDGRFY